MKVFIPKRPFVTMQFKDFIPVEFPKRITPIIYVSIILYNCNHENEINKRFEEGNGWGLEIADSKDGIANPEQHVTEYSI